MEPDDSQPRRGNVAVSVIIPAYNNAATIGEALRSVAAQSYANCEVIIVDDGSADSLADAVRASRVECRLIRQANAGPAAARNHGVANAGGEWIAFLDADDAWLPDKLALQMALAVEHPDVGFWCGATRPFSPNDRATERLSDRGPGDITESEARSRKSGVSSQNPESSGRNSCFQVSGSIPHPSSSDQSFRMLDLEEFATHNPVATSTVLVRRQVLDAAGGFDPQFRGPEDYDLWMRIAAVPCRMAIVKRALAFYRHRPGSLSMDDRRFLPEVRRVLDKAFGQGGALTGYPHLRKRALATQYGHASWMAFHRGSRWTALYLLFRAILQDRRLVDKRRLRWAYRYLFGARDV